MSLLSQLFSVEELDKLDEKQLKILNEAIHKQVGAEKVVRDALRKSMKDVYDKLKKSS